VASLLLQRPGQPETAVVLHASLGKLTQPPPEVRFRTGGVFFGQSNVAQVGQDVAIQIVVRIAGEKPLQLRLRLLGLVGQIGRFAGSEQRRLRPLPLRITPQILAETRSRLVPTSRLKQRFSQEEEALVGLAVVRIGVQIGLERFRGELPLSAGIVSCGDRVLIVRLIGVGGSRSHEGSQADNQA